MEHKKLSRLPNHSVHGGRSAAGGNVGVKERASVKGRGAGRQGGVQEGSMEYRGGVGAWQEFPRGRGALRAAHLGHRRWRSAGVVPGRPRAT